MNQENLERKKLYELIWNSMKRNRYNIIIKKNGQKVIRIW